MSDYLLDIGRYPLAKKLLRRLPIPLPLPEPLQRSTNAWSDHDLRGITCAVGGARQAPLAPVLKQIVKAAGGELNDSPPTTAVYAIVFDGTGLAQTADLGSLYDYIKPRLRALASGGRVLLIGQHPDSAGSPEAAACAGALVGFAKSLAKEIGRKGATCQTLLLSAGAHTAAALTAPLTFFLSARSAYISGQVLNLQAASKDGTAPLTRSLAKRTALVTGAAHGIGAAICRHLAAEGVEIYGHDRPQERDALAAVMRDVRGTSLIADLLEPHGTRKLLEQIETTSGSLDILINNAGLTRDKTLGNMPRDFWDDTLQVNLGSPVGLSEALLAKESGIKPGGRVLFMSSIAGLAGNAGQTNYAAAKAGLAQYVRAAATLYAGRGITVNALAPGFIETRMTQSMPLALREVARRLNSLKQSGQPSDVAEAAVFLALPAAASISGAVLRVCGQNLIGA